MKPLHVGLSCIGAGALVAALALVPRQSAAGAGAPSPLDLAEGPVIREHVNQNDIDAGRWSLDALLQKPLFGPRSQLLRRLPQHAAPRRRRR